jgi:hypothetical protein
MQQTEARALKVEFYGANLTEQHRLLGWRFPVALIRRSALLD